MAAMSMRSLRIVVVLLGVFYQPSQGQVQEPNCGIRGTARILGGSNVKTSWPWQVQVLKLDTSHIGYEHKCGGVLLNKRYVLTTAGCLFQDPYPTFYKVKVGEYDLSKPDPGEEAIAVDSLIINREVFASDDRSNDIALIKLSEDVRYGSTVSPVCLPERMTRVKPGQKCYMTGWGRKSKNSPFSNILQEVVLPVVDIGKCAAKNKHLGKVDRWTMICAGYDDKATSGCYGDSGSPLVCDENGRWVVRGLASWGDPNCDGRRAYPVFTRVQQYMHWIMFGMIFPQRPYPRCRDNHWSCSYWHRKGLCNDDYFKHSLRKYCPETCGHCKET